MNQFRTNTDAEAPGSSVVSRSLKVLHVIDHLGLGGAQVLLCNLVRECSDVSGSPLTHEVLVLHGQGVHANRLREAGVPVRSLAASKRALPAIVLRLAAHLSRHDYD